MTFNKISIFTINGNIVVFSTIKADFYTAKDDL